MVLHLNRNKVLCFDSTDKYNPIRLGIFDFYDILEGMIVTVLDQQWFVSDLIYIMSEKESYAYLELL